MFWPDDKALMEQTWWAAPLWDGGPTYGALVAALRPAVRAALLLGYAVESINYGEGQGVTSAPATPADLELSWRTLDHDTLELRPAETDSPAKTHAGPNVWLGLVEIGDLVDDIGGTYAVPVTFDILGSDEFDSVKFLSAVAAGVDALIDTAVAELVPLAPDLPRESGQGLLWIFDPVHLTELTGLPSREAAPVVQVWETNPTGFLRGQLTGDRVAQTGDTTSIGPASLFFLAGPAPGPWYRTFWPDVAAALWARGEAHRWLPQKRGLFQGAYAPTFLDMLVEMAVRGIVLVEGLCEPYEPIQPIQVDEADNGDFVLSIWDGDATVTVHRQTVFDGGNAGLVGSVVWDYVPGDGQREPAVVIVAGRGVQISHKVTPSEFRPWRLEIYRVQDDAAVQRIGAVVDPSQLLSPSVIEPYLHEYDPTSTPVDTETFPKLVSKPTPTGLILQFPVWGGQIPATSGPISGLALPPDVVELRVPPGSGTAAYAVDAHYFTYTDFLGLTTGGVHLCVWATSDVTIHSNRSEFADGGRGSPSALSGSSAAAGGFVAELWQTDRPTRLDRPWSRELPLTDWALLFPGDSGAGPDIFPHIPMPATLTARPRLDYDPNFEEAAVAGGVTLTAAFHTKAVYGYGDSLGADALDVVLGLVPVIGDIGDIGEAAYAWQTGQDKWGRPIDNFQLALMTIGAGMPVLSSGLLVHVADLLRGLPADVPGNTSHLFDAADGAGDFPLEGAQKAIGVPDAVTPGKVPSPDERRLAEGLLDDLGGQVDSFQRLAQRLVGDQTNGWLSADDLLSEDGQGFLSVALHTAYTRYLRAADVTPREFVGVVDAAE